MNDIQTLDQPTDAMDDTAKVSTEAAESTTTAVGEGAASLAAELKEFGVRIAAFAQAAVNTPEAQELRSDVIDGVRQLREQFDGILENLRTARKSGEGAEVPAGGKLGTQLRGEAASLLRTLNRGLEKLAGTVEPSSPTVADAPAGADSTESSNTAA